MAAHEGINKSSGAGSLHTSAIGPDQKDEICHLANPSRRGWQRVPPLVQPLPRPPCLLGLGTGLAAASQEEGDASEVLALCVASSLATAPILCLSPT